LNLYYRDKIEKYISINRAPSGIPVSATAFQRYQADGDLAWPVMLNVSDTVPIFPFANNGRTNGYGVSELRHVLPLQDALNKTIMDTLVAMEFAAYPQRVITGLQDAPDDDTKDSIARFEAGITRILALYGTAGIAEFSAANITQYIAMAEFLDLAIARVTKVPVHYLTMTGDFGSGVARRMAELPFTRNLTVRTRAFGWQFGEASRYGLRLDGKDVAPGAIRVNWEPVSSVSDEDVWELIAMKVGSGMPFVAALREAGYEPDQIQAIQEEAKKAADEGIRQFNRGGVPNVAGRIADDDEDQEDREVA
ncbi:MAG: phage portal protein, partial [Chloroflexota bacterium]|nr:phage portal protein [Chloroflexota bacterium]